ncbi:unnamed protein product, partial [Ixodes hexagonus]
CPSTPSVNPPPPCISADYLRIIRGGSLRPLQTLAFDCVASR